MNLKETEVGTCEHIIMKFMGSPILYAVLETIGTDTLRNPNRETMKFPPVETLKVLSDV